MGSDWRDKTCQSCAFCVRDQCRKNPPLLAPDKVYELAGYPLVHGMLANRQSYAWQSACADYEPDCLKSDDA